MVIAVIALRPSSMSKKALLRFRFSLVIIGVMVTRPAESQSAFSNAVINLNPVAYWPLQETVQPPAADVETNLGSLGAAGNAYYSSTNVIKGAAPIPGDTGDFAVACSITAAGSFLAVPTTTGAPFLPAGPFSVEVWVDPTNVTVSQTIIAQTGAAGSGGPNGGANSAGWSLNVAYVPSLNATTANSVTFHVYNGVGFAGGAEASYYSVSGFAPGTWFHIVGVFDGTNAHLYVNTVPGNSTQAINGTQALDTWDELTIGCGRGLHNNQFGGSIDEVAIYTNALTSTQVTTHYSAGSGGGNYENTILADHPYMYWRMDAPAHTTPSFLAYPTAFNYGTGLNINGLYLAGTTPGVAGPNFPGFASPSYACAMNGIGTDDTNAIPSFTNGVPYATNTLAQTGIIITNLLSSMNLTTNSHSFMCWFRENPSDQHRGVLIGHSDNGWRTSMDPSHVTCNGTGKDQADTSSSPLTYNDGNWHFAVIVYTNSGVPTAGGFLATNYIYVDGLLTASRFTTNINSTGSFTNVAIGEAPDKSSGNANAYTAQVLSGSIAHVAYFSNALTSDQIVNLYTNATQGPLPVPVITGQPVTGRTNSPGTGNNGSGTGSYIFFGVQYVGATTVQWYYNSSSNYAGATSLTTDNVKYVGTTTGNMTISNLVDSDSGYYYVVLGNGYGYTTSILASLTIENQPFITGQTPQGGTLQLYPNQNFTLSITAGGTNLAYQWYTNGAADTTAGTTTNYSLTSVQTPMSGNTYYCVASNAAGTATSAPVTLTVTPLPAAITGSAYATSLLALHPTVYFPMHETAPAVPADIETNYGTLGAVANGTYADWNLNGGSPDDSVILHNVTGALANDPDPAEVFNYRAQTNSYLLVPHTSPQTTLTLPFTIEAWVRGANNTFGDIVSQDGTTLNVGNANNKYGIRLSWGGNIQVLLGSGTSIITPPTLSYFQWHHVVLVCDTNNSTTNITLYVDGSPVGSAISTAFLPDSWDPLTIGAGLWNNGGVQRIASNLGIDEVAIYNTNLDGTTISTHYNDAINGAAGQYFADVISLGPLMYYRMDRSAYSTPASSTWPVMTNYGIAGGNGIYQPGLAPGSVAGPNNGVGLFASSLSGTNAAPMNGMSTFASAFNPSAFNVLGATTPLSFSLWFKGNPADSRYQALVSQGPGWQMAVQQNGTLQFFLGSSFVNTHGVYNDGNWHQVVVTYANTNGLIYVDGSLDSTGTNVALTNPPPVNNLSMCIGTDPRFTGASQAEGAGRQFAGDICEMAFWNGTQLTASQVQALYNSSGAAPDITRQPISASVNELSSFTNSVTVIGANPLSYQWYRDGLPLPTGGQTNLPNGATNASLVISPVKPSDASTDYYVVITNSTGAMTSSVVSLTVFTQPVFTNEPILITLTNNIQLFAGATPTFKVAAVGATPIYYQWFTNGVAATSQGTNLTSFTLSAQPGLVSFYCVASNFVSPTTNTAIGVTILNDPTAPYPVAVLAANPIGYWRLNETNAAGNSGVNGLLANDYWGANNGIYSNADLGMQGYNTNTDPSETSVQFGIDSFSNSYAYGIGGIDFSAPVSNTVTFSVEAWVNGFAQAKDAGLVSKGYGGGEQFDLDTGSDGGTPSHAFRFFVRDASGNVHSANSSMAPDGVWHHLVGVCDEANSNVTLYVDGAVAGSTAISPGSGILSSSRLMLIGSRPSGPTTGSDFGFQGTIDDVAVYNRALSANQIASQYSSAAVAPNLTQAPGTNVSVNGFGTLTLPAGAVGTPTLYYTWFDTSGGTNVAAGSTNEVPLNASLTVSNVPPSWNGDTLELTVTNAYGSTNYFVTLAVFTNAPLFTLDLPPQVQVVSGKSYTYSVNTIGAVPIQYQWYNGSTPLSGQTNSSYSLVAGNLGSTTYFVVAANAFGSTTSTVSTFTSIAQVSGYQYATNILDLHPVGYWPLQETNTPAPAAIETNHGSLGALGTAYYVINTNASGQVTFGQGGALTGSGDNDPAVAFNGGGSTGYALVPRASPSLTLNPPFTIECWANPPTFDTFGDIVGDRGTSLNSSGSGVSSGVCVFWEHTPSQFAAFVGTGSGQTEIRQSATPIESQWHHLVLTCDANDNFVLYVDGVADGSATVANYVPSLWNPLTIGAGFWDFTRSSSPFRNFLGSVDEVAVYTNALSATEVNNHYLSGITPGSNYVQAVQFDQPQLYYRMDCSGVTNPPETTCPEAVNYGSAAPNGFYLSGVPPGALAGPTNGILGFNVVAAPINGVISCVDAGSDPSFNPSGNAPFTALTWFRSYPSDSRVQTIISHGATNWAMNLLGTNGTLSWNVSSASQLASTTILNDGNWHFAAGVYDGTNSYLYVDGQLNASVRVTNSVSSEPNAHIYLGGNSDLAVVGTTQQYFAGALAQAAFFTGALNASQIQALYVASVVSANPTTNATITGFFRSGTNLVVLGTNNNVPNTNFHYVALTATNLATPLSNWTPVVTNPFNPDGTFDYTNPIVPGTPRQFIDVKAVP